MCFEDFGRVRALKSWAEELERLLADLVGSRRGLEDGLCQGDELTQRRMQQHVPLHILSPLGAKIVSAVGGTGDLRAWCLVLAAGRGIGYARLTTAQDVLRPGLQILTLTLTLG